jgi:hypothetical protein
LFQNMDAAALLSDAGHQFQVLHDGNLHKSAHPVKTVFSDKNALVTIYH